MGTKVSLKQLRLLPLLLHKPPDGFLGLHLAAGLNLRILSADVNKNLYFSAGELITIAVRTKPTVMVVINHMSPGLVSRELLN